MKKMTYLLLLLPFLLIGQTESQESNLNDSIEFGLIALKSEYVPHEEISEAGKAEQTRNQQVTIHPPLKALSRQEWLNSCSNKGIYPLNEK